MLRFQVGDIVRVHFYDFYDSKNRTTIPHFYRHAIINKINSNWCHATYLDDNENPFCEFHAEPKDVDPKKPILEKLT